MKRLMATTAVGLFLAASPALAGDVWDILQDFDITDAQNVINELTGINVGGSQIGTNTANSVELVDPSVDGGATGDSYTIVQRFDEVQAVENTVTAAGNVSVSQSGADYANLVSITDAHGGTTDGDVYSITQEVSVASGSEVADQRVFNHMLDVGSISASAQSADLQMNVTVVRDTGGGTELGNTINVVQSIGDALATPGADPTDPTQRVDQEVHNFADAATTVDGIEQTATVRANQIDLALSAQTGTGTVTVTQTTSEFFNQSIVNRVSAGGSAVGVSQSGTSLANIVNWAM